MHLGGVRPFHPAGAALCWPLREMLRQIVRQQFAGLQQVFLQYFHCAIEIAGTQCLEYLMVFLVRLLLMRRHFELQ